MLFDLQIFSGGVYPPSATSRTISFSISSGISMVYFFHEKDGVAENSIVCFGALSRHLREAKRRTRTVSKSATFWGTESVNSALFKRGETNGQIFGKEKCKTLCQY